MDIVIVRAYRDEPVRLMAFSRENRLVYVASESSLERIEAGLSQPIGVPSEDVFSFDETLYETMRAKWQSGGGRGIWDRLTPWAGPT